MPIVLLKKNEVAKGKSLDRSREIQEGLKLAKRVDALRETVALEDASLQKFRGETLAKITKEISEKCQERDELEASNKVLRAERIRLEAPIDLTQEWEQVRKDKEANREWNDDLLSREIGLTQRENEVIEAQNGFFLRDAEIKKKSDWAENAVSEAHRFHQEALNDRREAQNALQNADTDIKARYAALEGREAKAGEIEANLAARESQVRIDQETIINEKRLLADRQKMLERGFAELRRKQHG